MSHKTLEDIKSLSPEMLEKIVSAGFTSIESLCWVDPEELSEKIDLELSLAQTIIEEAQTLVNHKPISAAQLLQQEEMKKKLSTGSKELDRLLGGGIFTKEITEISGEFATGKTQLCFQLCINVQLPFDKGGLEGGAYYIDTEGTFSSTRIAQIARLREIPPKKILENIAVTRTYNSDHLMFLIKNVGKLIEERNIKLLIIDSIAAHFRAEYIGDYSLVRRQQTVMSLAETLKKLFDKYDVAIVVTNQVIAAIDDNLFDQSPYPALGFAWAHRPHQRILLRKGRGPARIARMYDSSRLPDRECVFFVTERGIEDNKSK